MRFLQIPITLLAILLLAGCATTPQSPVSMKETYWEQQNQRLGIFFQPTQTPQLHTEGDVRLLDYAIISAAMSSVKSHFADLDMSDYELLSDDINKHFSQGGKAVKVISDDLKVDDLPSFSDPNTKDKIYFSRKDYSNLKKKLEIDQLLIIKTKRVGLARPYAGFVPMGDPRAIFEIEGELVDLNNNQLIWYQTITRANFSTGNWDEPPTFPGLTNAFYASLEAVKQEVMTHFERGMDKQAKLDNE
ncbi:MAG: hypothetical protein KZQ93_00145 [Candidatus Thiodiazotropha sp. (ex Monitilora ramsayi)]|nr:hypothetical protein [Candidatus Thiodiazotropha sp. (ex Monitilora ramsayi)]